MKDITGRNRSAALILKEYVSYIVAVAILVGISIINPAFVSPMNITNILSDMSPLLLLAAGMTFVILIGSIDLSVGALSSCTCVTFAITVADYGYFGMVFSLLLGVGASLVIGVVYVKMQIPSFIATFGAMGLWQSLALILAQGAPQQIKRDCWGYIDWFKIKAGVVPLPFIIAIAIVIALIVVERRTKFGRTVFAIGGNESAARMVGLKIDSTKIMVFALMGLLAAVAGIFFAAKLKSGIPTVGDTFTLTTIAAVALGGTSLSGGKGGLVKTIAGVLLVIIIQNGMNIVGVDVFWQRITFGVIIIVALAVTTDRKRRNLIVK
ncbi:MAG: ABC transporter permease [Clostridiales Family XIII bacterium]|jgi:ribose/xylose/arabinose/galactoside ABC-type transport system permease subunit|nr:ABC transporter permease [Clostridiales Family XIII bacterium]